MVAKLAFFRSECEELDEPFEASCLAWADPGTVGSCSPGREPLMLRTSVN